MERSRGRCTTSHVGRGRAPTARPAYRSRPSTTSHMGRRPRQNVDRSRAQRPTWDAEGAGSAPGMKRGRHLVPAAPILRTPMANRINHTKGLRRERREPRAERRDRNTRQAPSPARSRSRGGAFVVVRARESRAHREGRQSMSAALGTSSTRRASIPNHDCPCARIRSRATAHKDVPHNGGNLHLALPGPESFARNGAHTERACGRL